MMIVIIPAGLGILALGEINIWQKLGSKYTKKHGVRKLTYLEEFESFEEACSREKQIKG